ncbi:MAG TPA: efflux transporter outer membrane subunit [Xanthobacteraceae bacterium]|nr:efflux transporter outer membrane subunit [Xanthobacteraceae bacterium]
MWTRAGGRSAAANVRASRRLGPVLGPFLGPCLALLVSGCILGTEKPDLALEVPQSYRAPHGAAEASLPPLDWWRGFRSSELTQLMEEAQAANFDIAVAIARIRQADAQAKIAGAPLFPTLDLNASATRSRQATAVAASTGGIGGSADRTVYNANLTASYVLDFWGQNRAALLAAEQSAINSRFNRDVVALTTIVTVANTYFQVLAAQDRLRIAREDLAAATRILNLIQQRLEAGTASALDIAQQQTLVDTQRAAIPPLEQTLRQSIAQLALLVGRAPEHFNVKGGSMSRIAVPRVTPGLPSEILNQRPDIRAAEAQLASTNYSVESARAAFFPNIALTGTTGFQSAALRTLFGPGAWFYTAAAALAQPIFDGFLREGELDLQRGRQQEALQTYRKSVISAFSDVEIALIAIQQTAERERLQTAAVASARKAFDISETRLREGTVDLVTVLQTQQTLFQNEDLLAQARLAHLQAIVSLFQALGGGWSPVKREMRHA